MPDTTGQVRDIMFGHCWINGQCKHCQKEDPRITCRREKCGSIVECPCEGACMCCAGFGMYYKFCDKHSSEFSEYCDKAVL